jgi:hypothetical protein
MRRVARLPEPAKPVEIEPHPRATVQDPAVGRAILAHLGLAFGPDSRAQSYPRPITPRCNAPAAGGLLPRLPDARHERIDSFFVGALFFCGEVVTCSILTRPSHNRWGNEVAGVSPRRS